jgi:hypothetical protein
MKPETVTVKLFPGMIVSFQCEDPSRLVNFLGRTSKEQNEFEESIDHKSKTLCLGTSPYKQKWQWELARMLKKAGDDRWTFERIVADRDEGKFESGIL